MDITPQDEQQQPISDDQELAKALAGVMPDVPEPVILDTPASAVAAPTQLPDATTDAAFTTPAFPPVEPASTLPEPTPATPSFSAPS